MTKSKRSMVVVLGLIGLGACAASGPTGGGSVDTPGGENDGNGGTDPSGKRDDATGPEFYLEVKTNGAMTAANPKTQVAFFLIGAPPAAEYDILVTAEVPQEIEQERFAGQNDLIDVAEVWTFSGQTFLGTIQARVEPSQYGDGLTTTGTFEYTEAEAGLGLELHRIAGDFGDVGYLIEGKYTK